jgi:hypothetical protein
MTNPRFIARLMPTLLASLVLCSFAAAQTTYLVGPSGLPTISLALSVAQDGDILHIEPGTYQPFQCNVGVKIRALQPGSVTVGGTGQTRFQLTGNQRVHLSDLAFTGNVQFDFGRAAIIDCDFVGQGYTIYAHDADLHFVNCSVKRSGFAIFHAAALRVDNCNVTAIDSTFGGGATPATADGDGIAAWSSQLHLSNVEAYGDNLYGLGGGVNAMNNTVAWITDSAASSSYSCPIRAASGSVVHIDGVTTIGTGGNDCGTTTPKSMLAVTQPLPLLAGAPFRLDYRGQPNGIVVVFVALRLGTHNVFPVLDQPSWLEAGTSFVAGLAMLDANGNATLTWNIPNGPAIPDQTLWFKGISGLDLPLQVAPVAGGVVR